MYNQQKSADKTQWFVRFHLSLLLSPYDRYTLQVSLFEYSRNIQNRDGGEWLKATMLRAWITFLLGVVSDLFFLIGRIRCLIINKPHDIVEYSNINESNFLFTFPSTLVLNIMKGKLYIILARAISIDRLNVRKNKSHVHQGERRRQLSLKCIENQSINYYYY